MRKGDVRWCSARRHLVASNIAVMKYVLLPLLVASLAVNAAFLASELRVSRLPSVDSNTRINGCIGRQLQPNVPFLMEDVRSAKTDAQKKETLAEIGVAAVLSLEFCKQAEKHSDLADNGDWMRRAKSHKPNRYTLPKDVLDDLPKDSGLIQDAATQSAR